jgi:osmoprotectant transport system substrate-binding protein/osmoprotectant transport system permease protein
VNEKGKEMRGVMLLDKLGFNNTYTIATTQEIAERYGLETISDLARVAGTLIFGGEHDFFTEEGSAKFGPFSQFYGLNFREARQIDINLKYSAIQNGNIDVTVVYATDSMNRAAGLKILADDRNYFPEYNGALLVRADFFDKYRETAPNLDRTLAKLGNIFTNEDMIGLSYEVDINHRTPAEVARGYLQQKGLVQ